MSATFGPERLIEEFRELGYILEKRIVKQCNTYVVFHDFEIPAGRFAGRVIDLALMATPDWPNSVHSSIHVKADPQLYEKQNIPNLRNVLDSELGQEWKYWSKNFNWNGENQKNARRYMAKINSIFEYA